MKKVLLVYTSMTGNTEEIAIVIASTLQENKQVNLTKVDIFQNNPDDLEQYDCILIGSYTYGDGDIPDEMLDFCEELEEFNLKGKLVAVFGSGDSIYDDFCGALDQIAGIIVERNGYMPLEPLKVEMEPEKEDLERCIEFAKAMIRECLESPRSGAYG